MSEESLGAYHLAVVCVLQYIHVVFVTSSTKIIINDEQRPAWMDLM